MFITNSWNHKVFSFLIHLVSDGSLGTTTRLRITDTECTTGTPIMLGGCHPDGVERMMILLICCFHLPLAALLIDSYAALPLICHLMSDRTGKPSDNIVGEHIFFGRLTTAY